MLEHGGSLRAVAERYGIPLADWLDLSTGINPLGWPVPSLPAAAWQRLPEVQDRLDTVAAAYYGSDQLLPVAGSQAAIQTLPALRAPTRVAVLEPTYVEHSHAWRRYDHAVQPVAAEDIPRVLDDVQVLLLCNPNNPTGVRFAPEQLLAWRARLAARNGWLVVDEAFMDATPAQSLAASAGMPGLIILRSLGKFFGLAGARVGFVLAEADLRQRLREWLGPWTVSGPARWVATQALADRDWQQATRLRLHQAGDRLAALLNQPGLLVAGGTPLFQWVLHPQAEVWQEALARQGIWVRRFATPPSLRLGLPGAEADWQRLAQALVALGDLPK